MCRTDGLRRGLACNPTSCLCTQGLHHLWCVHSAQGVDAETDRLGSDLVAAEVHHTCLRVSSWRDTLVLRLQTG